MAANTRIVGGKENAPFVEACLFSFMNLWAGVKEMSFIQISLFLFIATCPIQDFVLQETQLRSLGGSPCVFPLCALALVMGAKWLFSPRSKIHHSIAICMAYVLLTALYGLLVFGMSSHGENLLWKGATSLASLGAILFAMTLDFRKTQAVRTAIYIAFGLVILGFLFGNSSPLGLPAFAENGVLHFTPPILDERPRGLASEPAQLSITATVIGLLAVHITRSPSRKVFVLLLTLGLLLASGSKGGILTLFTCVIIVCVLKWHSKWYQVVGLLFVLFPLGLILIWLIPNLFPEELFVISGTVPTRFSMILCALKTVVHHPLGVGVTGFLPAVAKYLPDSMSAVESFFSIPLNFGEVEGYLTSADTVSTKTFFFDQLMRFGIPFAWIFFTFITRLLKDLTRKRQTTLFVAVLISTIAIMTYQPGTGNFAIPILFGVAATEVKNETDTLRSE